MLEAARAHRAAQMPRSAAAGTPRSCRGEEKGRGPRRGWRGSQKHWGEAAGHRRGLWWRRRGAQGGADAAIGGGGNAQELQGCGGEARAGGPGKVWEGRNHLTEAAGRGEGGYGRR